MSARFFREGELKVGRLDLEGAEAHHLQRVRRLEPGDPVEIFNGRGVAYRGIVVALKKTTVCLDLHGDPLPSCEPLCSLTLGSAIPKGDRFDWLVEKATELGVARLIPLVTDHGVVTPRAAKIARLRKVVIEASKQSGRSHLMDLADPLRAIDWLESDPLDLPGDRWLAELPDRATGKNLRHPVTQPITDPIRPVALAVGPEGGWSEAERHFALATQWQILNLGRLTLRVETAALAGVSALLIRS